MRWCAVACLLGDESQQPTCPHVMQMRRCTQRSPGAQTVLTAARARRDRADPIEVVARDTGSRRELDHALRCRPPRECPPSPDPCATWSSAPTRNSGAAWAKPSGGAGEHQLVAGLDDRLGGCGTAARRAAPPRRRAAAAPVATPTAGAPARIVTVRRARQSVAHVALDDRRGGPLAVAQHGVAAAPHRLLVALDLRGREVVAPHHVGEELHHALQLLRDDAVGARRGERLHFRDVAGAHEYPHGRVRDPRHRGDAVGHRRVVVGDHQHLGAVRRRRAAACAARLESPRSTG